MKVIKYVLILGIFANNITYLNTKITAAKEINIGTIAALALIGGLTYYFGTKKSGPINKSELNKAVKDSFNEEIKGSRFSQDQIISTTQRLNTTINKATEKSIKNFYESYEQLRETNNSENFSKFFDSYIKISPNDPFQASEFIKEALSDPNLYERITAKEFDPNVAFELRQELANRGILTIEPEVEATAQAPKKPIIQLPSEQVKAQQVLEQFKELEPGQRKAIERPKLEPIKPGERSEIVDPMEKWGLSEFEYLKI